MVVLRHLDLQIMKKYIIPILLAAAAMLTVQCAKEELTDGTPAVPEETVTITLQGDVTGTKTILDPETGAVYWEEGDMVWINGENYSVIPSRIRMTLRKPPYQMFGKRTPIWLYSRHTMNPWPWQTRNSAQYT